MSLPLASAARIGPVEFVSRHDGDLARPLIPAPPEPIDGESPEDFEARAEVFRLELEAFAKDSRAFERRLNAARATQAWADVMKPEADPTVFVCRQIPWTLWERWCSVRDHHSLGTTEAAGTLLRMALTGVRGGGWPATFKVPAPKEHMLPDPANRARVIPTGLGKIAAPELLDQLAEILGSSPDADGLCRDVIEDIGTQIHQHRMQAPGN